MKIEQILKLIVIMTAILIVILNNKKLSNSDYNKLLSDKEIEEYISSLCLKFYENNKEKYTKQQLVVISIMEYETEVNNGGLDQFFVNSSRKFAPVISKNLEQLNAIKHKEHYDNFIKQNQIDVKYFESFTSVDNSKYVDDSEEELFIERIEEFDQEFYGLEQTETLYDLIIEYAKLNYDKIFIDIKKQ